jgi:hypothetical protein
METREELYTMLKEIDKSLLIEGLIKEWSEKQTEKKIIFIF